MGVVALYDALYLLCYRPDWLGIIIDALLKHD